MAVPVVLWDPPNGVALERGAAKRGWPEIAPGVYLDIEHGVAYSDVLELVGSFI